MELMQQCTMGEPLTYRDQHETMSKSKASEKTAVGHRNTESEEHKQQGVEYFVHKTPNSSSMSMSQSSSYSSSSHSVEVPDQNMLSQPGGDTLKNGFGKSNSKLDQSSFLDSQIMQGNQSRPFPMIREQSNDSRKHQQSSQLTSHQTTSQSRNEECGQSFSKRNQMSQETEKSTISSSISNGEHIIPVQVTDDKQGERNVSKTSQHYKHNIDKQSSETSSQTINSAWENVLKSSDEIKSSTNQQTVQQSNVSRQQPTTKKNITNSQTVITQEETSSVTEQPRVPTQQTKREDEQHFSKHVQSIETMKSTPREKIVPVQMPDEGQPIVESPVTPGFPHKSGPFPSQSQTREEQNFHKVEKTVQQTSSHPREIRVPVEYQGQPIPVVQSPVTPYVPLRAGAVPQSPLYHTPKKQENTMEVHVKREEMFQKKEMTPREKIVPIDMPKEQYSVDQSPSKLPSVSPGQEMSKPATKAVPYERKSEKPVSFEIYSQLPTFSDKLPFSTPAVGFPSDDDVPANLPGVTETVSKFEQVIQEKYERPQEPNPSTQAAPRGICFPVSSSVIPVTEEKPPKEKQSGVQKIVETFNVSETSTEYTSSSPRTPAHAPEQSAYKGPQENTPVKIIPHETKSSDNTEVPVNVVKHSSENKRSGVQRIVETFNVCENTAEQRSGAPRFSAPVSEGPAPTDSSPKKPSEQPPKIAPAYGEYSPVTGKPYMPQPVCVGTSSEKPKAGGSALGSTTPAVYPSPVKPASQKQFPQEQPEEDAPDNLPSLRESINKFEQCIIEETTDAKTKGSISKVGKPKEELPARPIPFSKAPTSTEISGGAPVKPSEMSHKPQQPEVIPSIVAPLMSKPTPFYIPTETSTESTPAVPEPSVTGKRAPRHVISQSIHKMEEIVDEKSRSYPQEKGPIYVSPLKPTPVEHAPQPAHITATKPYQPATHQDTPIPVKSELPMDISPAPADETPEKPHSVLESISKFEDVINESSLTQSQEKVPNKRPHVPQPLDDQPFKPHSIKAPSYKPEVASSAPNKPESVGPTPYTPGASAPTQYKPVLFKTSPKVHEETSSKVFEEHTETISSKSAASKPLDSASKPKTRLHQPMGTSSTDEEWLNERIETSFQTSKFSHGQRQRTEMNHTDEVSCTDKRVIPWKDDHVASSDNDTKPFNDKHEIFSHSKTRDVTGNTVAETERAEKTSEAVHRSGPVPVVGPDEKSRGVRTTQESSFKSSSEKKTESVKSDQKRVPTLDSTTLQHGKSSQQRNEHLQTSESITERSMSSQPGQSFPGKGFPTCSGGVQSEFHSESSSTSNKGEPVTETLPGGGKRTSNQSSSSYQASAGYSMSWSSGPIPVTQEVIKESQNQTKKEQTSSSLSEKTNTTSSQSSCTKLVDSTSNLLDSSKQQQTSSSTFSDAQSEVRRQSQTGSHIPTSQVARVQVKPDSIPVMPHNEDRFVENFTKDGNNELYSSLGMKSSSGVEQIDSNGVPMQRKKAGNEMKKVEKKKEVFESPNSSGGKSKRTVETKTEHQSSETSYTDTKI